MRRRLLFALWVPLASLLLLELALQLGALLVDPEADSPVTDAVESAPAVLALGDSWVAGAEAPAGEGFVDVLGRRLNDRLGDLRVVNKGRSGANSAHVALTAMDVVPTLRPRLVLVLVGQNNATNRYRVAEVEQRLAARDGVEPPPSEPAVQIRTLKLAKILWANLRGTEGYTEEIVELAPALPAIPAMAEDNEGRPVLQAPLLADGAGAAYLARSVFEAPAPSGDPAVDAAWQTLFAAARRQVEAGPEPEALHGALTGPHAVLARYALLRRARELGDWTAVRTHGLALAALEPRGPLRDLGAAEGLLLAGDWRTARALLAAASNRAPGFADVHDLACRFPAAAADRAVQEACEFPAWGEPTALDRARVADGTLDPEGAAIARRQWLDQAPWDLETRVDLAAWIAHTGDLAGADELMGFAHSSEALPEPVRPEPAHWRYWILRMAEPGDREVAKDAVERALADQDAAAPDAALLGAAAEIFSEYRFCAEVPDVAAAWYRARGDAAGFGRVLQPCLGPADIAAQLAALRPDDAVDADLLSALSRGGREPFDLLQRDLDLVLEVAAEHGATVLLVDYPNPSDDHAFLARVVAEYAASRNVPYVALRDAFAERLTAESWAEHLGPNGHCNARGYALMAELIDQHLERRELLP